MRPVLLGLFALALAGCSNAAIVDIGQDKVRVRATSGTPDQDVMAEARRGCGQYGRTPTFLSRVCLDGYCSQRDWLFACRENKPV